MKILFLSKRAYTSKDLLAERYGRVYEFSRHLAAQGHEVYGVALDYRWRNRAGADWQREAAGPDWRSCPIFPQPLAGLGRYLKTVRQLIDDVSPDVLVSVWTFIMSYSVTDWRGNTA